MSNKATTPTRTKPVRRSGHVFVSYAHEDYDRVFPLVEYLVSNKLAVWWAKKIVPGTLFRSVIQEKLFDAACVVVVWTVQSVNKSFVHSEADLAQKRGILVPVLLDRGAQIPVGFTELQYVDLTGWGGENNSAVRDLVACLKKLVKRSGKWQDYGSLIDDNWVIDQSMHSARELRELANEIATLGQILASESQPARDVAASLDEVHKTYEVVSDAISAFVEPAFSAASIDAKPFITFERGSLKRLISNGRGHCGRIATYYGRQGGLRDWIEKRTSMNQLDQADKTFGRLSTADVDLFDSLVRIGDVLTNESRAIANLIITGQQEAARRRIAKGREQLKPLEKELDKGIEALEELERKLGYARKQT